LAYDYTASMKPGVWNVHAYRSSDASKTPIPIPPGPWVKEDGFWRGLACFSCGCDCYRTFKLFDVKGRIFIAVVGRARAMDAEDQGLYELMPSSSWKKWAAGQADESAFVGERDESAFGEGTGAPGKAKTMPVFSPDGCHAARRQKNGIEILDVCAR